MRKTTMTLGLGLALTLGAAAASAQAPRADTSRAGAAESRRGERDDARARRGRGGRGEALGPRRGGPGLMLLRGITLTDEQKTRIETLRREHAAEVTEQREQFRAAMQEVREARERGDTATARAKTEQLRVRMNADRDRQIASLRTILTADQQRQFDANVAEWKERMAHRKQGGPSGERGRDTTGRRGVNR